MPSLDVIENTSEAHPLGIEDPGAVTRFQDGGLHASRMPGHPGTQYRGAWQSPWDWVTVPLRSTAEVQGQALNGALALNGARNRWMRMRIAPSTPNFCGLPLRAPSPPGPGATLRHHWDRDNVDPERWAICYANRRQ